MDFNSKLTYNIIVPEIWARVIELMDEMESLCELAKASPFFYKLVGFNFKSFCFRNKIYRLPGETWSDAFKDLPSRKFIFMESAATTISRIDKNGCIVYHHGVHSVLLSIDLHHPKMEVYKNSPHLRHDRPIVLAFNDFKCKILPYLIGTFKDFPEDPFQMRYLNDAKQLMIQSIERDYFDIYDIETSSIIFSHFGSSTPDRWFRFGGDVLISRTQKVLIWNGKTWSYQNKYQQKDPLHMARFFHEQSDHLIDVASIQPTKDKASSKLVFVQRKGMNIRMIQFNQWKDRPQLPHLLWTIYRPIEAVMDKTAEEQKELIRQVVDEYISAMRLKDTVKK